MPPSGPTTYRCRCGKYALVVEGPWIAWQFACTLALRHVGEANAEAPQQHEEFDIVSGSA